jgi:hypothetical protein
LVVRAGFFVVTPVADGAGASAAGVTVTVTVGPAARA